MGGNIRKGIDTLGAKDYAEDIVQESYIKLHMYASKEKLFNDDRYFDEF